MPIQVANPNLTISNTTAPSFAYLEDTVEISWTVDNLGSVSANADWDATDEIFERDGENNNQLVADSLLQVRHADITSNLNTPTSVTSGTALPLNWLVTNSGTGQTITSWTDKVYLSEDETFDSNDELIGQYEHQESLAAGESKEITVEPYTIPVGLSSNQYILIVSDAENAIAELEGENNNVVAQAVEIELAPYADLEVSDVTAPDLTIDDPARVDVSWTVTNRGTGTGYSDTWTDKVIASTDETIGNGDDRILGEYTHTGFLDVDRGATRKSWLAIALAPFFWGFKLSGYQKMPNNLARQA